METPPTTTTTTKTTITPETCTRSDEESPNALEHNIDDAAAEANVAAETATNVAADVDVDEQSTAIKAALTNINVNVDDDDDDVVDGAAVSVDVVEATTYDKQPRSKPAADLLDCVVVAAGNEESPDNESHTINDNSEQNSNVQQQEEISSERLHYPMDDIPEPIKVLDDIISEFEDATTKPAAIHCNSGENQSEDDGYMSLSRKNMSKKDSEDVPQTPSTDTVPECSFNETDTLDNNGSGTVENLAKLASEIVGGDTTEHQMLAEQQQLIQTTLPKARPASATTAVISNYSSLPCCGARAAPIISVDNSAASKARTGSCNGERNALGIDISAVHNAVLRGNLAKLPEPMLNEHPVTIYPGPSSAKAGAEGARGKRHQLINSVEKHKEVCHMLNPHSSSSSHSNTTTTSSSSGEASPAASNIDVAKCNLRKSKPAMQEVFVIPQQKTQHQRRDEDEYSADSLEEEESTISTDIGAPFKQNGIAWEIHFKSNKKKRTTTGAKKSNKKVPSKPTSDYNSSFTNYNQNNMLGKGTFVIRRTPTKKPPRAIDIFSVVPKPPPPEDEHELNANVYTSDSEVSESTLPPPPPAPSSGHPQMQLTSTDSNAEVNFVYEQCEASAAVTRRNLEIAAAQRAALASPRERLSLNIEAAHQMPSLGRSDTKSNTSNEDINKPLKKTLLQLNEQRLSAESMPDNNTSSSEEFDEARLNGNGFELFNYNANGIKSQEYEHRTSNTTTPHTDLAPTLEEDEELSDFSYGCAPLKQIENNISALLRGDIPVARIAGGAASIVNEAAQLPLSAKRPLEFRPGVHKSESAKEMLLSQNAFGPLPPSPPSSNPDLFDYDAPLPPSPVELKNAAREVELCQKPITSYMNTNTTVVEVHATASGATVSAVPSVASVTTKHDSTRRSRDNISALRHFNDELPPPPAPAHQKSFDCLPPAVPPHRGHSVNSMKSWSIDSNYRKKSPKMLGYGTGGAAGCGGGATPTGCGPMPPLPAPPVGGGTMCSYESGSYTRRHYVNYGTKRSLKQSPREEHRLQTSCSLPETPIFARGCDIPRTPYRRQNEPPVSGSRTAPRSSTSNSINMGTSIVGIVGGNYGTGQMCRQRSINHALASNEMLRMTGAPARGWYPKQRSLRPASTENIDRLASVRVWDNPAGMSGTGQSRKPLTLPPNLTPSFLNKSPREALRRVTSLLITKKKNSKERKHKAYSEHTMDDNNSKHVYEFETGSSKRKDSSRNASKDTNTNTKTKKKGLFKTLWKRTKHVSLDQ